MSIRNLKKELNKAAMLNIAVKRETLVNSDVTQTVGLTSLRLI